MPHLEATKVPSDGPFDLLVVGGGVNGAAIARDAALRGLSVCLVEAQDWGSGTSAKSSKLAHGGLRYLELFEFGLVHEALRDRERLLRLAPHLVRPLRFLYPLYPHIAARHTVRIGLWLYDLLSIGRSVPGRKFLGREAALALAPGLVSEGLAGAATFYDGQIHWVERLVLEMVLEARSRGATCLSRTRVDHLVFATGPSGEHVTGAVVEGEDGELRPIHARAVVNAAGCWVDEVLGPLAARRPPKVRKTKGTHVVVPRFLEVAVMVRAKDGRTFFILPWQDHCLIGTTDTDYAGDPSDAVATPDDVEYLTQSARRYFPRAPLESTDFVYAGVRALVNQEGLTESNVTRRHILYDHRRRDHVAGLWTLQGGKITTARTLAEECVDRVARFLGRRDARRHPTRTARYWGAPPESFASYREHAVVQAMARGLGADAAGRLLDRYGSRWADVLAAEPAAGAQPLAGAPFVLRAEVAYVVRHEDAKHVGDVLLRRTDAGLRSDGNPEAARAVAAQMAGMLGWDAARIARELAEYHREALQFTIAQG